MIFLYFLNCRYKIQTNISYNVYSYFSYAYNYENEIIDIKLHKKLKIYSNLFQKLMIVRLEYAVNYSKNVKYRVKTSTNLFRICSF